MSPRRRFGDAADTLTKSGGPDCFRVDADPARRWGLRLVATLVAVVVVAAIAASTLILVRHEGDRRAALNDAAVLDFAREFMTVYMTLDPANADAYGDRVLAQSTGEFAMMFTERLNDLLVQVVRSEPSVGTVLEAGVQGWNDDGSAEVLLATRVSTTTSDGKTPTTRGSRWIATTVKEGQHWKVSRLVQVL